MFYKRTLFYKRTVLSSHKKIFLFVYYLYSVAIQEEFLEGILPFHVCMAYHTGIKCEQKLGNSQNCKGITNSFQECSTNGRNVQPVNQQTGSTSQKNLDFFTFGRLSPFVPTESIKSWASWGKLGMGHYLSCQTLKNKLNFFSWN